MSANIVNRITANPRVTKTQIAKISYGASSPKSKRSHNSHVISDSGTSSVKETFKQKKKEREREVEEIKDMLNDIVVKPSKVTKSETNANKTENATSNLFTARGSISRLNSYRRCKTDLSFDRAKSATTRTMSSFQFDAMRGGGLESARTQLTKSHEILPTDSATSKKRTYDPEEARRYIKEQKKKRRSTPSLKPEQQAAYDKEQIRKRLEDLRKCSRMIVTKNLKKRQPKATDDRKPHQAVKESKPHPIEKDNIQKASQSKTNNREISSGSEKFPDNEEKNDNSSKKRLTMIENKPKDSPEEVKSMDLPIATIPNPTPRSCLPATSNRSTESEGIIENHRRVGLLRKPEMKDHSFSAIKDFSFDKENVALDMMTPKIPSEKQDSIKNSASERSRDSGAEQPPIIPELPDWQSSKLPSPKTLQSLERSMKKFKTPIEKSTQVKDNASLLGVKAEETPAVEEKCRIEYKTEYQAGDLPYWLRPSAVQIYPYNFIQAVRRKLVSIVEPSATNRDVSQLNIEQETPSTRDIPLEAKDLTEGIKNASKKSDKIHILPRSKSNISINENCEIDLSKTSKKLHQFQSKPTQVAKSQTISDLHSNLSSISLQLVPSNTVSEVSSIKSESVNILDQDPQSKPISRSSANLDDDTTVSSSILSSPEKQRTKKFAEREKAENQQNNVELRVVSPLSLEHVDKLKIHSKYSKSLPSSKGEKLHSSIEYKSEMTEPIDLDKLLSDFNFGLSQVIEANEQLKSTLDKSSQMLSSPPQSASKANSSVNEYATDFEAIATSRTQSQRTASSNEVKNHNHSKRKLFQIATPLLTSPKDGNASEEVASANVQYGTMPEFELNLGSVTPSSIHSSEVTTTTTTTGTSAQEGSSQAKSFHMEQLSPAVEIPSSPFEHEERLATIDQLKENLRRMISDSQAQRQAIDKDSLTASTISEAHTKKSPAKSSSKSQSPYKRRSQSERSSKSKTTATESLPQTRISGSGETTPNRIGSEIQKTPASAIKTDTTFTLSENISPEKSTSNPSKSQQKSTHSNSSRQNSYDIGDFELASHLSSKNSKSHSNSRKTRSSQNSQHHQDAFISSHVNTSRGSFISLEHNHDKSDETSFHMAVATISQQECKSSKPKKSSAATSPIKNLASTTTTTTTATATATASAKSHGSEIVTLFRISDVEISHLSSHDGNISDSSLSYSNVGLYEKLIKTETTKTEYLTALLKIREKALLDRTKGQIAWLEVQKERYKSKGLMLQIAAIRKKQRAILMKMEREREEIKRILQSTLSSSSNNPTATSRLRAGPELCDSVERQKEEVTPATLLPFTLPRSTYEPPSLCYQRRHQHQRGRTRSLAHPSTAPILRANYELESSASLEELLQQREEDLRKRRKHVEHLLEWHRKLDQEEAEVLNLECMLFNYNAGVRDNNNQRQQIGNSISAIKLGTNTEDNKIEIATSSNCNHRLGNRTEQNLSLSDRTNEMERRLKEIDKSLRELSGISATAATTTTTNAITPIVPGASSIDFVHTQDVDNNMEYVRTTGSKLNKLWRRLTSQHLEKFEPNRRYKLCKSDLERLYEEAKRAVLEDFAHAENRSLAAELLDKSLSNVSSATHTNISQSSIGSAGDIINAINAENEENPQVPNNCIHEKANDDVVPPPVPSLSLNFSTSQSEEHDDELNQQSQSREGDTITYSLSKRSHNTRTGDYSPSAAEINFQNQCESLSPPKEQKPAVITPTSRDQSVLMKSNMSKFLKLSNQSLNSDEEVATTEGLERSLSDTQISSMSKSISRVVIGASRSGTMQNNRKPQTHVEKIQSDRLEIKSPTEISADTLESVTSLKTTTVTTPPASPTSRQSSRISSSILESSNIPPSSSSSPCASTHCSNNLGETLKEHSHSVDSLRSSSENESIDEPAQPVSRVTIIHSVCNSVSRVSMENTISHIPTVCSETESHLNSKPSKHFTASIDTQLPSDIDDVESHSQNESQQASDFECKSNEIAAKLNEISEAVARLSLSNSINGSLISSHQSLRTSASSEIEPKTESALESVTLNENSNNHITYSSNFDSSNASTLANQSKAKNLDNETTPSSCHSKASPSVVKSPSSQEMESDNAAHESYDMDFERMNDDTILEEISMPRLDNTFDTTAATQDLEDICSIEIASVKESDNNTGNELREKNSNSSQQSIGATSPAKSLIETHKEDSDSNNGDCVSQQNILQQQLMPDIINELEIRRCQQILIENEQLRQYEQVTAVPYMYVREIPNKPPPPYCPPAHGSPMTTIFPSEERIKDITYRRTHELYCEILKTEHINEKGEKLPSVLDEQITNIYERIVLDICREFLEEHREVLSQGNPENFRSQLAFFNPPDRLRCIQESIYKEVRRCLGMDKTTPKRTPAYSIYGQRARRDHIGKIIIQEMYEEDDKWCNFHHEQDEVLDLIIEEMIASNIAFVAKSVLVEEGGIVFEEEEEQGREEQQQQQSTELREDSSFETSKLENASISIEGEEEESINEANSPSVAEANYKFREKTKA